MRPVAALVALSLAVPSFAFAQATTSPSTAAPAVTTTGPGSPTTPGERDAETALERKGYTQITDLKSSKNGITAKATKDGRQVSVSVDSSGTVKQR